VLCFACPNCVRSCDHRFRKTDMETIAAYTEVEASSEAGRELGSRVLAGLCKEPSAVVIFASPKYDHSALLNAFAVECPCEVVVGASSAGEFTREVRGQGMACALAFCAPEMRFSACVGRDLSRDVKGAAMQIVAGFDGRSDKKHSFRSALVMTDAMAGHADVLVEELTLATAGQYQFVGGGAGDDAQFSRTPVFLGTEVLTDAAVALEILSDKPIGIGASHGWEPCSEAFRVTEAHGMRVISLNGFPAVEAFQEHAEFTQQKIDRDAPVPFFLHNILGIEVGGVYRLRVPLAINDDGSVLCASEIPVGSVVRIMRSSEGSAITAAERASDAALRSLGEHKPKAALFFDCVATRLRLGNSFESELGAVINKLGGIDLAGCNTHGQIARAEGQFEGFHNCTAVVCVFPE
jgi:hypothetical protein